jgi:hypothetical protein
MAKDQQPAQPADAGQYRPTDVAIELRHPHPATAAVPAEQRRQWALAAALETRNGGETPPLVIERAKLYDAFLRGDGEEPAA